MCASLGASLPHLTLSYLIYPRFETRGDLTTAVSALRAWLAARVTELQASSSSPVKVVLVGHSMGGIVAAECALSLDRDCDAREWWPDVQGVLAFDTPYLGIAPGLVAHNAEGHWEKGRLWYQSAAGMWGLGSDGVGSAAGGTARDEDERAGESTSVFFSSEGERKGKHTHTHTPTSHNKGTLTNSRHENSQRRLQ